MMHRIGIALVGVVAAIALSATATLDAAPPKVLPEAQAALSPVAECPRLADSPVDISDRDAFDAFRTRWRESCEAAVAAEPGNPTLQLALGRALMSSGGRDRARELFRAAAAKDDARALYELFEFHRSWERGDVTKPPTVPRVEAEASLRRSAELGHAPAILALAVRLGRGEMMKRDLSGARLWMARAVLNPPPPHRAIDLQVLLARLLVTSEDPDERRRGIEIFETVARTGRGDAKAGLAEAVRAHDAVRARALLEEALRTYPGSAIPPLTDMLIKGEGGPADPTRALSILRGRSGSDVGAVKAALGQVYLEGRLVPRDVQEAIRLIHYEAVWSYEARLQVMRLLAANPHTRITYPEGFVYTVTENAELGEPGAAAALVALKLSPNAQFRDTAGACALAKVAVSRGDPDVTEPDECTR